MRDHEVFETFCRHCLRKFEAITLAESIKATEEHERECERKFAPIQPRDEDVPQ